MKDRMKAYYMAVALDTAALSYAERKKVGAVIVKNGNIIAFGYNGTPNGRDNCCEIDQNTTKPEVLHAESNALIKCLLNSQSTEGADLFVTLSPCFECSKLIVQSKIRTIYYLEEYRDKTPISFLKECGIHIEKL